MESRSDSDPDFPESGQPRRARPHPLDLLALVLFGIGAGCWATGALPRPEAAATLRRVLPLLLFLGTVVVLAELTGRAQTFDVVAARLARAGRGRFALLFLWCVLLAVLTTVGLNLDTTAVLLTPIMVAMARRAGLPPLPLAVTTAFLANTASLLLPVGNLTNLLAADRVDASTLRFAERMAAPEAVSVLTTAAVLWFFFWRRAARGGEPRYVPPPPFRPEDPVLSAIAGAACVLFVCALVLGAPLGAASSAAMGLTVLAFLRRRRSALGWHLLPWRLLVMVIGMFLVVQTLSVHGLDSVVRDLIGDSDSFPGRLRAAGTGAGLSNLVNNLPAYLAGEAAVRPANHGQLLALLIGTNVGPIVTPWASLAMLLWFERCAAAGLTVPKRRLLRPAAILAVTAVLGATAALALTG